MDVGGIHKLIKSSKLFGYRVDINRNLSLINLSGFLKFQFRVKVVYYKVFLLIIRGSKRKLKVISINNYFV